MNKTLIVAALFSAAAGMTAVPAMAADVAKPAVDDKCWVLPLLPDCAAEWNEVYKAHGWHLTTIPNAWWTCKPAAPKSGHLLDCDAK